MPIVATAVPKRPAFRPVPTPDDTPSKYEATTVILIAIVGITVDFIPTLTPTMMLTPCPLQLAFAILRTGEYM